jgi:hypothetical protein
MTPLLGESSSAERILRYSGEVRAAALLLACVLSGLLLLPPPATADFRGTVVDAGSGELLEGAVVVVVWRRYPYGVTLTHISPVPYKTIETLTNAAGQFVADDSGGFSPPFHSRDVFVYKPGYRLLRVHSRDRRAPLLPQPVAALTKATTRDEAREAVQEALSQVHTCVLPDQPAGSCVPLERVSHLVRLSGIQRKLFAPYPAGHFGAEEPSR